MVAMTTTQVTARARGAFARERTDVATALVVRLRGDDVDVDSLGEPHDTVDHRARHDLGESRTSTGAEHDLRGVLCLGERNDRRGDVVARHFVPRASELAEEGPMLLDELGLWSGEPVRTRDVDRHEVAGGAPGKARRTPDELVTARSSCQR